MALGHMSGRIRFQLKLSEHVADVADVAGVAGVAVAVRATSKCCEAGDG